MQINIHVPNEGDLIQSDNVFPETVETHIRANDHLAGEAKVLQAFRAAEFEAPAWPEELAGHKLIRAENDGRADVLTYEG